MRAHFHAHNPHQPTYGVPSPALIARAGQGYARFLAARTDDPGAPDGEVHARSTTVLYNPTGRIEAELPLDRGPHEFLAKSVLAWTDSPGLEEADYEQTRCS